MTTTSEERACRAPLIATSRRACPASAYDLADQLLPTKMGIEITEWDPKRVVATMPVAGNLQPYGLLHGGANATLAETIGSVAAALNAGTDRVAMGLELSCTHHRAARSGHRHRGGHAAARRAAARRRSRS